MVWSNEDDSHLLSPKKLIFGSKTTTDSWDCIFRLGPSGIRVLDYLGTQFHPEDVFCEPTVC